MGSLFSDIGNAIGYAASGPARGRASRQMGEAVQTYRDLNPNITAQNVANPYAGVGDEHGAQQALGALNDLQSMSRGHGLTEQEASALQAAQLSNAQQQGSALQGVLNSAERAGTLNSGRAVAGQLGAIQNAGNANAQAAAQAAANSAAQRQQAMGQVGQLGGALEGQQIGVGQFNAGQNMAAQQATANNAFNQAQGIASGLQTMAGANNQKQKDIQDVGSKIGDAAGQVAGAAATGGMSGLLGMFGGK